jgi:hypothetical protein
MLTLQTYYTELLFIAIISEFVAYSGILTAKFFISGLSVIPAVAAY